MSEPLTTVRNDKRTIFGWAMYDWANSAYITIFGAVVGAFFTGTIMAGDEYWGLSGDALFSILVGLGSILLLLAMPVLGAIADYSNSKKRSLRTWAFIGALSTLAIPFVPDGQVPLFLIIVVVSQFGFVAANVFYDGYLPEIASDETMDKVSSKGFALGYLGGGLYLLLALVLISLSGDGDDALLSEALAARIAIFGSGIWWIGFMIFSLVRLPEDGEGSDKRTIAQFTRIGFSRTAATAKRLGGFRNLLIFVIAFVFYNSGVGTVIAISGPYAEDTLGLEILTIGLAFLLVQFIAFFGAYMFGALAGRIGTKPAIMVSLVIWTFLAVAAYFLPAETPSAFLALASVVGFVLGGVQALSRSLYGTMIPEEASAEFFGFFSVFSKLSGIGPLIFGLVSWTTGDSRIAILSVAGFFLIGMVLLALVDVDEGRASRDRWQFKQAEVIVEGEA